MQKANIGFEDLEKLDIRICKVLHAQRVEGTDKLIKLVLDTGFDEREAITNIGSQYEPNELEGKSFPFLLNLEPKKMRGVLSQAMIIAGSSGNGIELLFSNASSGTIVI